MTAGGPRCLVRPCGSAHGLIFHGLSFLPIPGPGSALAPTWQAFCRTSLPARCWELLDRDGPLIARMLGEAAIHCPEWATPCSQAAELDGRADPPPLPGLPGGHPGAGLLWADLALARPTWTQAWDEQLEPALQRAARRLNEALDALPLTPVLAGSLARLPGIALVPSLGLRGRIHHSGLFLGAPGGSGLPGPPLELTVVQLLHELHVSAQPSSNYLDIERAALIQLARACPEPLRAAHRDWLGALDLAPLWQGLVDRGDRLGGDCRGLHGVDLVRRLARG